MTLFLTILTCIFIADVKIKFYFIKSIEERVYSTNCSKTLSDDAIKVIDFISFRGKVVSSRFNCKER